MPDWVYRADSDPDLAQTQPVQFQKFITGQLDLQYSWLFAMLPPPDLATFGNNLFLSDPAFQQQEGFVAFDQEMEDYDEDDDYDEGEIQEDEESGEPGSVTSGKAQATPVVNPSTPIPNHAKAPLSQLLLKPQSGSVRHGSSSEIETNWHFPSHQSSHPNSSPVPGDKEAAQMKLEAMRAKLLASRKAGATPVKDQNQTSAPQIAPIPAAIPHLPLETQSSTTAHNNTNGQFAQEVEVLVEEYRAAAEAEKNEQAKGLSVNGSKESHQLVQSQAGSTVPVNPLEQYSKIQSLSARLPPRENKESIVTQHKDAPKPPQQLHNGPQTNTHPQTPAREVTRPNEPSTKKTEVQSKPPSRQTDRRQSTEDIVAKLPADRPSIARPSPRPSSPARQARLQIDTRPEPKPFVSGLHPEIEEWLDLTGYHDPEYRQATLNLMRKRKRLDELQSSLKQEELEFQEAFQAQSQAAHIVVGRRSSSVMLPPAVPSRLQNGNVSNTNISFDTPTAATYTNSVFKRQRSPGANDLVAPPQKIQRSVYPDDDREYKIRSATEQHHSRPPSPAYDQWHPARPRGGALESRTRGGGEAFPSAEYGARYYEGDEGNLAQRGSHYDDYADRDRDRGRARDWDYPPRGNAGGQRGRGAHRGSGNNHHKDNGRGARRG